MKPRCVILDDYQNVALGVADWAGVADAVEVEVFNEHLGTQDRVIAAVRDATIVCLMRERTAFGRAVIEAAPNLKLIVTTGMYNAAVDLAAAHARGIVVSGTRGFGRPTAELAMGLILNLARNVCEESARLKQGEPWQSPNAVGRDLLGSTLGLLGLGKLGSMMARFGQTFGMDVIAWSQNLTPERCAEAGAAFVSREELFARADFLSVHLVLSLRTRGLVGADDLARMKPSAFLVNTSRGPLVDTAALVAALESRRIAGAAIDVFDEEPLAPDHPLRRVSNALLTPHLGYVTQKTYEAFYRDTVEDIRAWLDGAPIRVVTANK